MVAAFETHKRKLFHPLFFRCLSAEIAIASQQPRVVFALDPFRAFFCQPSDELARANFGDSRCFHYVKPPLAGLGVTNVRVKPDRAFNSCQL